MAELASDMGEPVETVGAELAALQRAGLVKVASRRGPNGRVEETYSAPDMAEVNTADWERMDLAQRQRISAQILQVIDANINLAIEAGTFDARADRHLSHFPLRLDEQGWKDLGAILDTAFDGVREVRAQSNARQLEAGDGGIEARLILSLFELPTNGDSQD